MCLELIDQRVQVPICHQSKQPLKCLPSHVYQPQRVLSCRPSNWHSKCPIASPYDVLLVLPVLYTVVKSSVCFFVPLVSPHLLSCPASSCLRTIYEAFSMSLLLATDVHPHYPLQVAEVDVPSWHISPSLTKDSTNPLLGWTHNNGLKNLSRRAATIIIASEPWSDLFVVILVRTNRRHWSPSLSGSSWISSIPCVVCLFIGSWISL